MSAASIFVSIAAYREHELEHTLANAFAMADVPTRLKMCICWQREATETLGTWQAHPQIQLLHVPYRESRGVCWARHMIQQEFRDEDYFLQLDGHHRFVPGWDTLLIEMLEGLKDDGTPRPVLTSYLPAYDPLNDPAGRVKELWLLGVDRFDDSGVLFMRPYIPLEPPAKPVPTRFWSAHFSFSDGQFVHDVPIDPHGYFHGEEIGTCVRAWTCGYDFFCPSRTLLWHEYSRKGRRCHWEDHDDWGNRNAAALARYAELVGLDGTARRDLSPYGLGKARSLQDYERFAGVVFATRHIAPETIAHDTPVIPIPMAGAVPEASLATRRAREPGAQIPKRSPGWTEEQLEGELALYNAEFTRACYLNDTAALVWHLIDGERSVREIIDLLKDAYADARELPGDVDRVLDRLAVNIAIAY